MLLTSSRYEHDAKFYFDNWRNSLIIITSSFDYYCYSRFLFKVPKICLAKPRFTHRIVEKIGESFYKDESSTIMLNINQFTNLTNNKRSFDHFYYSRFLLIFNKFVESSKKYRRKCKISIALSL